MYQAHLAVCLIISMLVITGRQNSDGSKNVVMTFPQMLDGGSTLVYTFTMFPQFLNSLHE